MSMRMQDKSLDFLLIGAHKSGTTSLYRFLRKHPAVYMPKVKDMGFFAVDELYERGWEWYRNEWFSEAPCGTCLGDASVAYMQFDRAAKRIYKHVPHVKLVAVLRNPIDRAFSHYRMARRQECETRPFEQCVLELIDRGNVPDGEMDVSGNTQREYIRFGQYGRILTNYLKWFHKDQLRVVFLEDLAVQPTAVLREVLEFLGVTVSPEYLSLGKNQYHRGGTTRWPSVLAAARWINRWLKQSWAGERLAKTAPRRVKHAYGAFTFWALTELFVKPLEYESPCDEIRNCLREYFRSDVEELAGLLGVEVPWQDFRIPRSVAA